MRAIITFIVLAACSLGHSASILLTSAQPAAGGELEVGSTVGAISRGMFCHLSGGSWNTMIKGETPGTEFGLALNASTNGEYNTFQTKGPCDVAPSSLVAGNIYIRAWASAGQEEGKILEVGELYALTASSAAVIDIILVGVAVDTNTIYLNPLDTGANYTVPAAGS